MPVKNTNHLKSIPPFDNSSKTVHIWIQSDAYVQRIVTETIKVISKVILAKPKKYSHEKNAVFHAAMSKPKSWLIDTVKSLRE